MLSSHHTSAPASPPPGQSILETLSWDTRVQLAELASSVREYNAVRSGAYMFLGAFVSLDELGRPVVVIDSGAHARQPTSRRVITFTCAPSAIDFVAHEMFFHALKTQSGVLEARAWSDAFPAPERISDETYQLQPFECEEEFGGLALIPR